MVGGRDGGSSLGVIEVKLCVGNGKRCVVYGMERRGLSY